MANLTRYTPHLNDFFAPARFGDALRNFILEPVTQWDKRLDLDIRTDMSEDDKTYIVKAEIPGVKKEDIVVKVNGNQLILTGEVKHEKIEKEDEKLVHSERYYGKVSRSFMFDCDIDTTNAQAKYEEGVLKLTLPKSGASPTQQLKVT